MKETAYKTKEKKWLKVAYIAIFILCIIAIGIAVYSQFFKDENLGAILGMTSKEEEQYNKIKDEFGNIFDNTLIDTQNKEYSITKLDKNKELIYTRI